MAMPYNGVFLTREMGSMSPVLLLDSIEISDTVINALKLDNGDSRIFRNPSGEVIKEDITPDKNNFPIIPEPMWSINTEFYGVFNGDFEAGPLFFSGQEIDSIAIRRSSNRTNLLVWEDVNIIGDIQQLAGEEKQYIFSDKAIESGVLYKYSLQPMIGPTRGQMYRGGESLLIYEDKFLVGENGKQLKLKFNSNMSSVKRILQETKTETIGSKYPFIRKNANIDYKEYTLSGTITHFMDSTEEFAPRAELFIDDAFSITEENDLTDFYNKIYEKNGLNDHNNTVLEREFRDKVESFLNDGKPKLLKSPNEKNALVRIMGVTLSPNQVLGGLIYDFSCTAVEIDSPSLENLKKYNIQG